MADDIERGLADHLRKIAAQVKAWENRDVQDQIAAGSKRLSRPAYFHDLEMIAAMLEGRHREVRLKAGRAGKGRPPNVTNVDRDMAIVRFIDQYIKENGATVARAIDAAKDKFAVSEETAEAAWGRFRNILGTGNEALFVQFEKLAARGLVKITKTKTLDK